MKIIWSPLAVEKMTNTADYISKDNPSAAIKWAKTIFKKVEHIQEFPYLGRIVPEANRENIRELLHGHYRIIYRVESNSISILTIRHGKQLLPPDELDS